MKNKEKKIVICTIFITFVVLLTLGVAYYLKERREIFQDEAIEKSGEEILLDVYQVIPVSGELVGINLNEKYVVLSEDDEESRYYYSDTTVCYQIGKPGQDCLNEETKCEYKSISCNIDDIKISQVLGVDLDLGRNKEIEVIKVYYIAQ